MWSMLHRRPLAATKPYCSGLLAISDVPVLFMVFSYSFCRWLCCRPVSHKSLPGASIETPMSFNGNSVTVLRHPGLQKKQRHPPAKTVIADFLRPACGGPNSLGSRNGGSSFVPTAGLRSPPVGFRLPANDGS